jgi:plasmid stability protein
MNLTLKQVPPQLHRRLKVQAEKNRRSLNSEVLHVLENAPAAGEMDDVIASIREINMRYQTPAISAAEIRRAIAEGRR